MRKIVVVKRIKEVYTVTPNEFRSGDWLKNVPIDSDIFEVEYKNNFLSIRSAKTKKEKSEKEDKENEIRRS